MNDIERAIEKLKSADSHHTQTQYNLDDETIEIAILALEKQLNNGWIPVSEGLPKYDGTYYCTVKVKEDSKGMQAGAITGMECVYVNKVWKNVWFQEISHIFNVTAWQPLPEEYKEV